MACSSLCPWCLAGAPIFSPLVWGTVQWQARHAERLRVCWSTVRLLSGPPGGLPKPVFFDAAWQLEERGGCPPPPGINQTA